MPPSIADLQRENERLTAQCQQLDAELTELRQCYEGGSQSDVRDRATQERAKLLSTVAQVANLLLRSQDYATVMPDVVRLLGEAVGCDRCTFLQGLPEFSDTPNRVRMLNEWHQADVPSVLEKLLQDNSDIWVEPSVSFLQKILKGEIVNFITSELSEPDWRVFFEEHNIASLLIVPIMLSESYWGDISFHSYRDPQLFDEVDIAVLQVAAESIAATVERQQQNEALRESEERYRTLFELSNEGIYRFELDPPLALALPLQERLELGYQVNQIVEVNQAFAEQYGFDTPEDLVGTKIGDFYDHEYSQVNDGVNVDLMRDLRVAKIETVETDRLGHRHWFLSSVVCDVRDDAIVGGWGVQTDVTELKQAQQALLEAEQARAQELERFNAELQQALEQLQARDRILELTATSANELLSATELDTSINSALQMIGETLSTDRVNVIENIPPQAGEAFPSWRVLYEWDSLGTVSQLAQAVTAQGSYKDIQWLYELFQHHRQSASYTIEEAPEPFRSQQMAIGVKSTHIVPIFINENWWGVVAFDDCQERRDRDPAELSVLKTAAACIGSAIERDRTQKAILQAEQDRAQELEQMVAQLQGRDRVLQATATAADALLTTGNLEEAVNTALQIIGESLDTDRIAVLENEPYETVSDLSQVKWELLYEWHSSHIFSQLQSSEHKQGTFAGIETWPERLAQGESISYPLEALPEPFRSKMAEVGVQSIHEVPIFVEGQCWGALGIDDCRETRHRDPAELAVLKTAAACIGSAIERDRTQKAILQAEQARAQELQSLNLELQVRLNDIQNRDFIAETAATVSNVLLREESLQSAMNRALQILGQGLNLDRVAVIEVDSSSPEPTSCTWQVLYEWDASDIPSQMADVEMAQGTFAGIETLYEKMSQGRVLSYLLDDLPEPFRSGQAALEVKALHEVPIFVAGQFWGAIGFDNCREAKRLSQTELSMLKIAADCIGSVIQRERLRLAELRTQQALLKAQQDRVAELAKTNLALKNSLDRLAAAPDLEAFLGYVLTEISQQFDGKTASLHLFDPDSQTLHLHQWVAQGRIYARQEFHQFGPLAEPIIVTGSTAWAFLQQHKLPLVINRDNAHQYMFPDTEAWQLDWAEREDLQAGINILLSSGETPLGMMCMFSASRSTFTDEELEIAQALSHQATLAIQLTQLATKAQQSAILGERNRLARDIHDTLAQSLGGIVLHLQAAESIYTTDLQDKQTHLTQARQLARQALTEARRSVQALRPQLLEQATLDQALNSLLQQITRNSSLQIAYDLHGNPYRLPPEVEEHLLRISQEAITNSVRHAQATALVVDFTYEPRQVQLRIQDNGQGFDRDRPTFGYGLITMQERAQQIAAHLHLSSQLGQGTIVQITLPIATSVTGAFYD